MGVHDHKEAAPKRPLVAWVVTISSTRDEASDTSGDLVVRMLEHAGHHVSDRTVISDDVAAIRTLVRGLAGDGTTQVVICNGGTGISARDVTPEALDPLFTAKIPGFGELFRVLSYHEIGSAAMLSRAVAGMVGPVLVFALPGSPDAVKLGLERLILPELWHLHHQLLKDAPLELPAPGVTGSKPAAAKPDDKPEKKKKDEPAAKKEVVAPALPAPTGVLGRLGRNTLGVGVTQQIPDDKTPGAPGDELPRGWERAVYEVRGEVTKGTYEELPEELEKVSPVIDVLHKSGARGRLKLPSGRIYALFGFPNLEAGAKVIAIASGSPIAEVVALHRYPVMTGTTIDEAFGLLPKRSESVTAICETVTGRAPKDASGQVFAVQGDAVWIQRGSRAFTWDGSRERDEGTLKQALATLVLDWSSR
jgi:molybdenum cofactor biosynthesis protein B